MCNNVHFIYDISYFSISVGIIRIYIKRRLRPQQPGRLSKVLKDVAEMQLNSQVFLSIKGEIICILKNQY
jgi:hypothetical protein|tara:strand:- start:1162 stop:1371 length:210 start_codon:yes stop_codon:yes gene_type:complete